MRLGYTALNPLMANDLMVFWMLERMSREPSRICSEPPVPPVCVPVTATMTRLASWLGGTGRLA